MKEFIRVTAYTFLITGAIFIDTPIIALLAIPVFIAGTVLLIKIYNDILRKFVKLVLSSIVLICGSLAYIAADYNQYLVSLSSDEVEGFSSFFSNEAILALVIYFIASLLAYFGLKRNRQFSKSKVLSLWLPIVILPPLVIAFIQYLYQIGGWLGG